MKNAFSLMEIMVVISLIGVTTVFIVTSYNGYQLRQQVTQTAARIKQVLLEAKANALAVKVDCSRCDCTGNSGLPRLSYWEVKMDCQKKKNNITNNIGYDIWAQCGGTADVNIRGEGFQNVDISVNDFTPVNWGRCKNNNGGFINFTQFRPDGTVSNALVVQVRSQRNNAIIQTVTVNASGMVQ